MRLENKLQKFWCVVRDIMPKYKQFLCADGSILVKVKKALYGCVESGKLWNDLLNYSTFKEHRISAEPIGTVMSTRRTVDGAQCTVVVVNVDDLIFTCTYYMNIIQKDSDILKDKYNEISIHIGDVHSYLGMVFYYGMGKISRL